MVAAGVSKARATCDDLRLRGRHRRIAADLADACRFAMEIGLAETQQTW
jgi:hypothetical protein